MLSEQNKMLASCEFGRLYEWDKWVEKIPFIKFPADWEIQVIPPFAGAVIRFVARKKNKVISVYLDCYEQLGFFGGPHWEAYPIKDDNARYAIDDSKKLIADMKREFARNVRRKNKRK